MHSRIVSQFEVPYDAKRHAQPNKADYIHQTGLERQPVLDMAFLNRRVATPDNAIQHRQPLEQQYEEPSNCKPTRAGPPY